MKTQIVVSIVRTMRGVVGIGLLLSMAGAVNAQESGQRKNDCCKTTPPLCLCEKSSAQATDTVSGGLKSDESKKPAQIRPNVNKGIGTSPGVRETVGDRSLDEATPRSSLSPNDGRRFVAITERVLVLAAPTRQTQYRQAYDQFERLVRQSEIAQRRLRELELRETPSDSDEYKKIARQFKHVKTQLSEISRQYENSVGDNESEVTADFKLALRIMTEHMERQSQVVQKITS